MGFDEHWKIINNGATVISNTPEQLWEQACKYFEWCDTNPIKTKRTLQSGKEAGRMVMIESARPYTIEGFCLHAGINKKYIQDIEATQNKSSQWYMVIEKIMYIIYNQLLERAVTDIYNPIMVSKILNLDKNNGEQEAKPVKVEIIHTGKNNLPNTEAEILQKLDFGKVDAVISKSKEQQEQRTIEQQEQIDEARKQQRQSGV